MFPSRSLCAFVLVCASSLVAFGQASLGKAGDGGEQTPRGAELRALRAEVDRISARLSVLEANARVGGVGAVSPTTVGRASGTALADLGAGWNSGSGVSGSSPATSSSSTSATVQGGSGQPAGTMVAVTTVPTVGQAVPDEAPRLTPADRPALELWRGTTLNVAVDGYYGYNFNAPVGRVNLLRAYDVSSNSFSVNQADVVVERLPTADIRVGGRLDLQFGQATETLQGSGLNEQRPQVWRNLFQAYGSWLAPVGKGLQLDFGKFASSLGNEGNYTKDQIAYSRGFSFDYLPFYHMGLRANYQASAKVGLGYWLVNGANDTEDLNGYKSQAFLLTLQPASTVKWNVNYYVGQEGRSTPLTLNAGTPTAPTQPGLPLSNISPAPNGREHILNSYATWQATPKLKVVGEADLVINRQVSEQRPGRVALGAVEGQYDLGRSWNVGWRGEYLDDRGGLFSGATQALKEGTAVLNHDFGTGFQMKMEYRRDWSNRKFFLSDTAGALEGAQTTATVGLVYWWGMKDGAW